MKSKGDAHKALSLMFQREGIPPSTVMDGLKEQTLGKFCQKFLDVHCQLKQTEPYSPWKNAAEREIKKLKKGSGCKMLATGAPRQLWDDCLEFKLTYVPIVPTVYTALMARSLKPACLVRLLT